ncbi:hypothetical protein CSPX01_08672 [Colletotrichum filicis]|nr:hypothetical protein CSPX01_08672 [Colletotrichum filicis]
MSCTFVETQETGSTGAALIPSRLTEIIKVKKEGDVENLASMLSSREGRILRSSTLTGISRYFQDFGSSARTTLKAKLAVAFL